MMMSRMNQSVLERRRMHRLLVLERRAFNLFCFKFRNKVLSFGTEPLRRKLICTARVLPLDRPIYAHYC